VGGTPEKITSRATDEEHSGSVLQSVSCSCGKPAAASIMSSPLLSLLRRTTERNMHLWLRRRWLRVSVLSSLLVIACDELPTPAPDVLELTPIGSWPDAVRQAEIWEAAVYVRDGHGRSVTSVPVRWESSDSSVISIVEVLPAASGPGIGGSDQQSVVLAARAKGTAEIHATIDAPHLGAEELSFSVDVTDGPWPSTLAVTRSTPVSVITGSLSAIAVAWQSTDPSILKVEADSSNPAEALVTARSAGTAEILADVVSAGLAGVQFRLSLRVESLAISPKGPWPEELQITESLIVSADVVGAEGDTLQGQQVAWRSSNEGVLRVQPMGTDSVLLRGVGRGQAELVATVGGGEFEVSELHHPVSVRQSWASVSSGYDHTCALAYDKVAYCWGANTDGQLGDGGTGNRTTPDLVATFYRFDEIEVAGRPGTPPFPESGDSHSCALGGTVLSCWGASASGQLGTGTCRPMQFASECSQTLPITVDFGQTPYHLGVGPGTTCAAVIELPPSVECIGSLSTSVRGLHLDAGAGFVCVVTTNSTAQCSGTDTVGQLGNSGTVGAFVKSETGGDLQVEDPNGVSASTAVRAVTAGYQHACALEWATGDVYCWGSNEFGQLGSSTGVCSSAGVACSDVAMKVQLLPDSATYVSAGALHTCALTRGGAAYCWGGNGSGQIGDGTQAQRNSPAPVTGGILFSTIDAGWYHTCGVTLAGSLYCWGDNSRGQLGNSTVPRTSVPVRVDEPLR
jgi:alpha-tubulin suppressor-like RCC1 family protein